MDNPTMDKNQSVESMEILTISSRLKLTEGIHPEKNGTSGSLPETENYNPFDYRDMKNATSNTGALFNMLKSSLGTGILAMPNAFRNGGLILGIFGTIIVGFICTHCVQLLVHCSQVLCTRNKRPTLGFVDTAEAAFQSGPESIRPYAPIARKFVTTALICTYFFGCAAYVIFIGSSFEQVIENHLHLGWGIRQYIVLLGIPILCVGIVRTMKYTVPFSALATILIFFGLSLTVYYIFIDLPPMSSRNYVAPVIRLPLFFSTVLFAMEGIGIVLPIENSMKQPENFLGCPGVLNGAMTFVVAIYAFLGFFGYLRFGNETQGSVTLNLSNAVLAESVKILVALSVLLSYGLQFGVPVEAAWRFIKHWVGEENSTVKYYILRATMIIISVAVAAGLPSLSPFISLIGAIGYSTLGLFCPPVIEIVTFWEDGSCKYKLWFYKDMLLILTSVFSLVSGTYASVLEIIAFYRGE